MNSVLFVTPGPIKWASSRLRAHWVAEQLEDAQVWQYQHIDEIAGRRIESEVIVFVKIAPLEFVKKCKDRKLKIYWDLCDPVHWFNPNEARQMADLCDGVVCSNFALGQDFAHWYNGKTMVSTIADRLKLSHYPRYKQHYDTPKPRLIWYGAGQNRFTLMGTLAALERLAANGVSLSLTICDDHPQDVWKLSDKFPIYHVNWELEHENEIISDHDIALLPPYPGAWGAVKSNNKSLTAWTCGLPVADGTNYNDLYRLATEAKYRQVRAKTGYDKVMADYDVKQSAQDWQDLFDV